MGQSNSRSKHHSYPLSHPGNLPPGAYYPPYPAYPAYNAPNRQLIVPYPIYPQPTPTRRKKTRRRRRPSASEIAQPYMGQAASTSNRPVLPMHVPVMTEPQPVSQPDNLFTPMTNGGDRLANFPTEPQMPEPPRGRAQTPYHAPVPPPESDEDEDEDGPSPIVIPSVAPPSVSQHRRRHSEPLHHQVIPPPPLIDPTRPSAFDRPVWSPSGNPLPEPPRDLFDSEAYKAVLNIPRGTDLMTALYGYQRNQIQQPGQTIPNLNSDANPQRTRTGLFGRKNSLFRTLTGTRGRRQAEPEPQPQDIARTRLTDVRLVPFPVAVERVRSDETQPQQGGAFRHVPPSEDRYIPATLAHPEANANAATTDPVIPPPPVLDEQRGGDPPFPVMLGPGATNGAGPSQINAPFPVMTAPPRASSTAPQQQPNFPPEPPQQHVQLPPLIFTQFSSSYQGFFPHSPHRVMYNNAIYPTATHLHEALKYLPSHPTIAAQIRLCVNLNDVYPLSAANTGYVRPDWGNIFLDEMEKVLEFKFRQHAELRNVLIEGVEGQKGREIIYRDENDMFWGDGGGDGKGANELGKILAKVRDKLIEDRDRSFG